MKKITLLFVLVLLPFIGISQTFDFNGTDDGFSSSGSCTLVPNATFLSVDLTGDGTNPAFGTTTASVDADTNFLAGVTLKNADPNGPTFMRISYPKASGGRRYVNLDITAGDLDYVTYWFDLSNADWAGTEDDVKVHFKAAGNTNYTIPTAGVTVEVDKIQFVAEIPEEGRPEKTIYEFNTDGDTEGWTANNSLITVQGGTLTLVPEVDTGAKMVQGENSVDTNDNDFMHIVYKNESALNNQVRIQFRSSVDDYTAFVGTNASISQGMTTFETLSVDLASARPDEWVGLVQDFQIVVRDTNNDDVTNNGASAGDFVIDRIEFNKEPTLSISNAVFNNLAIYPNPSTHVVHIEGVQELSAVSLLDIQGRLVLNKTTNLNLIDVSGLASGQYLLKIVSGQSTVIKKVIVN